MKKKLFVYLLCIITIFIVLGSVIFNFNTEKKKENITLAEVAHTVFYAPLYVAIENGYFIDNNLDIELILTSGADKVSSALLSGDADIGLCGAEATIYVYNGGEKNYLKTFAQLTQKDGTFIVSRKKIKDFTLDGMPEMTLEYALLQNGIDPKNDVNIDTSIAFPAMSGTFIGGYGDFVTLFEPTASQVEKSGYGYVVASVGELGGIVPYTSFSARKKYIDNNPLKISAFNKAIKKGLDFVHTHTDEEVAKVILPQFPDSSLSDITAAVKRYRKSKVWPETTTFKKSSCDHLQDIMITYGELDKKVAYKDLIYKQENK